MKDFPKNPKEVSEELLSSLGDYIRAEHARNYGYTQNRWWEANCFIPTYKEANRGKANYRAIEDPRIRKDVYDVLYIKFIDGAYDLNEVLEKHRRWLNEPLDESKLGEKAVLHKADLCGTILIGAELSRSDLSEASLVHANLHKARLYGADLHGADLRGADMSMADLREADLCGADLRGAVLVDAALAGAKFDQDVFDVIFPSVCPTEGEFVAWKTNGDYLIKLRVLEDAKRSSAFGRKCRCSKAEVLEIQKFDGTPSLLQSVPSRFDPEFIYTKGQIVEVFNFDECRWNECSTGIHFFITRQEAVDYTK